jgi:3-deoxy-D-arabino-heptulosonate 7-phosphate (DAHP) synthase class II
MIEIKLDGYTLFEMPTTKDMAFMKEQLESVPALIAAAVINERERCAKVAENGVFLHEDSPAARFGKECAAAIRRGK